VGLGSKIRDILTGPVEIDDLRGQDNFAKGIGTEYEAVQVRNTPYAIASAWNIVSPFLVPEVSGFSREISHSSSVVPTTVTLRHWLWQRTAMPKSDFRGSLRNLWFANVSSLRSRIRESSDLLLSLHLAPR
jgi:hypothetical protein